MTRDAVADRVEFWRLRLTPEWRITVTGSTTPPEEMPDCRAMIQASEDYHHADLWIAPAVLREELGEIDVTIVHELLHLLMREMRRTLDLIEGQVAPAVHSLLEQRFTTEEEGAVERLARVIALLEHPDGMVYGVHLERRRS